MASDSLKISRARSRIKLWCRHGAASGASCVKNHRPGRRSLLISTSNKGRITHIAPTSTRRQQQCLRHLKPRCSAFKAAHCGYVSLELLVRPGRMIKMGAVFDMGACSNERVEICCIARLRDEPRFITNEVSAGADPTTPGCACWNIRRSRGQLFRHQPKRDGASDTAKSERLGPPRQTLFRNVDREGTSKACSWLSKLGKLRGDSSWLLCWQPLRWASCCAMLRSECVSASAVTLSSVNLAVLCAVHACFRAAQIEPHCLHVDPLSKFASYRRKLRGVHSVQKILQVRRECTVLGQAR